VGGTDPKRRTSVSALTAQFLVMEDLAAQAKQQQVDATEAQRENLTGSAATKNEDLFSAQKVLFEKNILATALHCCFFLQKLSNGDLASSSDAKLLNTMCLIEWDLPRTFPTLGFFHDGGPMHTGLERILLCYACFRPEIGYVQVGSNLTSYRLP
jgi:hypothetical protein